MYNKNQNSFQSFKETDEKAERTTTECNNYNLYKCIKKYRARKLRTEHKLEKYCSKNVEKRIRDRGKFSQEELQSEEWRQVLTQGLENFQVSNLGRIRNSQGKIFNCSVVCFPCRDGSKRIVSSQLHANKKFYLVHRLVAEAFLENPFKDAMFQVDINHKDGNPLNNRVSNLEYCSHMYNIKHGYNCLDKDTEKKKYYDLNSHITEVYLLIIQNKLNDCYIDGEDIVFPSINRQCHLLSCNKSYINKHFGKSKRISINQQMYS